MHLDSRKQMNRNRSVVFLALLAFLVWPASTKSYSSDPWPSFRGPSGDGIAPTDCRPPTRWSPTQNIAWRVEIPGQGWSTPIVGEKRIYISAAIPSEKGAEDDLDLSLLILDRATGEIERTVTLMKQTSERKSRIHKKNSHASPTPILSNDRVYVHFGYQGTACCDRYGNLVWKNRDLFFRPTHGNGGTPVLVDGKLVFTCDGDKEPKIVALDATTGELAWSLRRPVKAKKTFSFCTPTVIRVDGKQQVVAPGSDCVLAIDPSTGETIWDVRYTGYSVVPKPVFDQERVYVSTSFDNASLLAIRPSGSGIVTDSHIDWEITRKVSKTPSMIVHQGLIYFVSDDGVLTCAHTDSGETAYSKRLGGGFSASPVMAGGLLYFVNESGETTVIKPGDPFESVATNDLGERTLASPAIAGNELYLRTDKALYRIESDQ